MQARNFEADTHQLVDQLFQSGYFLDRLQELQLQTYKDIITLQAVQGSYHALHQNEHSGQARDELLQPQKFRQAKDKLENLSERGKLSIKLDDVANEIGDLLMHSFKESVFKEANEIYDQRLTMMSLREQIENIKQTISKMGQTMSFASASTKACATQESISPEREERNPNDSKGYEKSKPNELFFEQGDQSSIQICAHRRNFIEDKQTNLSFMSSFLNENKNVPDEQIINSKINASISKIESSIEDRIAQVEREFTARIEQVMKTIKNLIQMMNENGGFSSQSPFGKKDKGSNNTQEQSNLNKLKQAKLISSKSTYIPSNKQGDSNSFGIKNANKNVKNAAVVTQVPASAPSSANKNQSVSLLNKSSNKITSFFKIGKNS